MRQPSSADATIPGSRAKAWRSCSFVGLLTPCERESQVSVGPLRRRESQCGFGHRETPLTRQPLRSCGGVSAGAYPEVETTLVSDAERTCGLHRFDHESRLNAHLMASRHGSVRGNATRQDLTNETTLELGTRIDVERQGKDATMLEQRGNDSAGPERVGGAVDHACFEVSNHWLVGVRHPGLSREKPLERDLVPGHLHAMAEGNCCREEYLEIVGFGHDTALSRVSMKHLVDERQRAVATSTYQGKLTSFRPRISRPWPRAFRSAATSSHGAPDDSCPRSLRAVSAVPRRVSPVNFGWGPTLLQDKAASSEAATPTFADHFRQS
jgi:hypothetical protein